MVNYVKEKRKEIFRSGLKFLQQKYLFVKFCVPKPPGTALFRLHIPFLFCEKKIIFAKCDKNYTSVRFDLRERKNFTKL